jgi:hypothetical protein
MAGFTRLHMIQFLTLPWDENKGSKQAQPKWSKTESVWLTAPPRLGDSSRFTEAMVPGAPL